MTHGCSTLARGGSGQGVASVARNKTPAAVSVSKVRAHCTIWLFPRQIKLTFGRRSRQPHQYSACGGHGSGRRDHSLERRFKQCVAAVRPPGSGRLNNDTGGDIFPERHQQLACQRHDGRLLEPAAVARTRSLNHREPAPIAADGVAIAKRAG